MVGAEEPFESQHYRVGLELLNADGPLRHQRKGDTLASNIEVGRVITLS